MSLPVFKESQWFTYKGCSGRHFILGNPHTFRGRMMGWCPLKERSFFFSKSEVEEDSSEAAAWIEGFLAGNEPPPPRNGKGDVDFESAEYLAWAERAAEFRASGALPESSSGRGA